MFAFDVHELVEIKYDQLTIENNSDKIDQLTYTPTDNN